MSKQPETVRALLTRPGLECERCVRHIGATGYFVTGKRPEDHQVLCPWCYAKWKAEQKK